MTRMLNGHLVRDPHAEADGVSGKFECQTVREAVLEASAESRLERGNGPLPAREVQTRGRRW